MDTKPSVKNFVIVILPALLTIFVIFFLVMPKVRENRVDDGPTGNNDVQAPVPVLRGDISNFEDCVAAGNSVMESYPRQCRHGDAIFTEDVVLPDETLAAPLTEAEARDIAEKTCVKGGEALGPGMHNDGTGTWWFDANLNSVKEGCNPACVVSDETHTAEINWRCTGLIMPR